MKSLLILLAALSLAPRAFAEVFPTPTSETITGHAFITGGGDPSVTAIGDGEATLYYGVSISPCGVTPCSIVGTPGTAHVITFPLQVTYSITASSGAGQGLAEFGIYDVTSSFGFGDNLNCSFDGGQCGTSSAAKAPYDYWIDYCGIDGSCVSQNTAYVYMHVYASGGGYAQVDPIFTIDPDYLIAHPDATLNVATILPLSGAVPEPATWAMMIVGPSLCGAILRKKRSTAAA